MSKFFKSFKTKMRTVTGRVNEVANYHLKGWTVRQWLMFCYLGVYPSTALTVCTLPDVILEPIAGRELGVWLLLAVAVATPIIAGVVNMLPSFSTLPGVIQLTVNVIFVGLMSVQGLCFKATKVVTEYLHFQPFRDGKVCDIVVQTAPYSAEKVHSRGMSRSLPKGDLRGD